MKLLLFGNPALPDDTLALQLGAVLEARGHETLHLEDPLGLVDLPLDDFVIMDVALDTDEPRLLEDPDRLLLGRLCSLHDLDMAYMLKLLKRLERIEKVRIIALPQRGEPAELLPAVEALLRKL